MGEKRVIALVDCNNFFVSCECLKDPSLVGKAVCVLSNNDGCVVSRSNEAKRMGVSMGAPYFMIKHQFKKCKFLSGDLTYYCEISQRISQKLLDFTPDIEIYSIDEAFLDLTGLRKTFNMSYEEISKKIVKEIKNEIGIDVTVGLSYSKVLSKLACDKSKTIQKNLKNNNFNDRVYKIGYYKIEEELKSTLISEVWGVGKNTSALLKKHLIQSAWEFCVQDDLWIKRKLGKIGLDLKQELLGNSINPVVSKPILPKSISRSESFSEFQTNKNYIQEQLNSHIHKVCKKLREKNLTTSCIFIMLRTKAFEITNVKYNLVSPTNCEFELIEISKKILNSIFNKYEIYRSCGFSATKFNTSLAQQISLFDNENKEKKQNLSKSWDKLEEKFGKNIIKVGM